MTTFSAGLTNLTVILYQSRQSILHVAYANCSPRSTHLTLLQNVDSTDQLVSGKGLRWIATRILATDASCTKVSARIWHFRRSDCIHTLIYAHTTSRTHPTCDTSCRYALSWRVCNHPSQVPIIGNNAKISLFVSGYWPWASPSSRAVSYRLWCVVFDQETSRMGWAWPALGRSAIGGIYTHTHTHLWC